MSNVQKPSRACDTCRLSKIRCDRNGASTTGPIRCSNCLKRGARCSFELPIRKRGPRRGSRRLQSSSLATTSSSVINSSVSPPQIVDEGSVLNSDARSPQQAHQHQPSSPLAHSQNTISLTSIGLDIPVPIAPKPIESPQVTQTPADSHNNQSYRDPESSLWLIWQRLLPRFPGDWDPAMLIERCIDEYMIHLFAITPLVHEPSVRAIWSWAFGFGPLLEPWGVHLPRAAQVPASSYDILRIDSGDQAHVLSVRWTEIQGLALLTALCATCCFLVPVEALRNAREVAPLFLQASRDFLRLYVDQDIDHPTATSVVIRYFHAISVHATGNARTSWYLIGEAVRLTLELRLYDESALTALDPVETTLRRAAFWQLYTGDQSAAILNNRPLTLHPRMLDITPSTRHLSYKDLCLLSPERHTAEFARQITAGFNLCSTIWCAATDILLDLKLLDEFSARSSASREDVVRGLRSSIVDSALIFHTALDEMPESLQHPELYVNRNRADTMEEVGNVNASVPVEKQHMTSYWAQHVNLKVTYACLRLFLLQKATDLGLTSLLGFSEEPRLLAMQKTEIAKEVLACIQAAPFEALQVNGEPCVEKIRQVGAVLLQLSQGPEPRVAARAKADFQILLNILARLDSKASDKLYSDLDSVPTSVSARQAQLA